MWCPKLLTGLKVRVHQHRVKWGSHLPQPAGEEELEWITLTRSCMRWNWNKKSKSTVDQLVLKPICLLTNIYIQLYNLPFKKYLLTSLSPKGLKRHSWHNLTPLGIKLHLQSLWYKTLYFSIISGCLQATSLIWTLHLGCTCNVPGWEWDGFCLLQYL